MIIYLTVKSGLHLYFAEFLCVNIWMELFIVTEDKLNFSDE